jgi:BNR repeat-containing family member
MTRAPSLSTARSTLVPYRPAATSRSELRVVRSRCMPRLRRTTTTTRPCFRRHSDGRILACYSRHGVDDNYYQRVSLNPDDLSAFGPEVNIGPALGASRYTYANLIETKHGIFNFVRCARCGESVGPHYSVSTDGGANWSPAKRLLTGHRPYVRVGKDDDRIDLICTDGHPAEVQTNGVYHCYFDGQWHKSDGSLLGEPPFAPSSLTQIHAGAPGAWVWDVAGDTVVYATFPALDDHRYRVAAWKGQAWQSVEICSAGGSLYPANNASEPYYSGGICIDPDVSGIVYCSRKTNGVFQIWKGVRGEAWDKAWEMTQLTYGGQDCFRPYKPRGSSALLFVRGSYLSYTSFSTHIAMLRMP